MKALFAIGCLGLAGVGSIGCGGISADPLAPQADMAMPDTGHSDGGMQPAIDGSIPATHDGSVAHRGFVLDFPTDFPVTPGLSMIRLGDVNGDGKLDVVGIAAVSPSDAGVPVVRTTVLVALGNGDGTFGAPKTFDVANSYGDIELADFNGDHKLDLVGSDIDIPGGGVGAAAEKPGSNVEVLLGNGDGTFGAPVPYLAYPSGGPLQIVTADFNKDGKVDIAVADFGTSVAMAKVSLLLGKGDGTF